MSGVTRGRTETEGELYEDREGIGEDIALMAVLVTPRKVERGEPAREGQFEGREGV